MGIPNFKKMVKKKRLGNESDIQLPDTFGIPLRSTTQ